MLPENLVRNSSNFAGDTRQRPGNETEMFERPCSSAWTVSTLITGREAMARMGRRKGATRGSVSTPLGGGSTLQYLGSPLLLFYVHTTNIYCYSPHELCYLWRFFLSIQYFLDPPDFLIVGVRGGYSIGTRAYANVGGYARSTLDVNSLMTVVYGFRYIRPGTL